MHPKMLWLFLLIPGCVEELPDPTLIEDTRILGVRPVPAAPDAEGPLAAAFSVGEDVLLQSLIVDREGAVDPARIEVVWLACPLAPTLPLFRCLSPALPLELDAVPACPSHTPDALPVELPAPCVLGATLAQGWALPAIAQADAGFSVELTLVLAEGDRTARECAQSLLRGDYDTPDGCEYAAGKLGLVGTGIEPPARNTHPRLGTITATLVSASGETLSTQVVEPGIPVVFGNAGRVDFEIEPPPQDAESFVIPINNGESVEQTQESLRAQWVRTAGTLEDDAPDGVGGGGAAPQLVDGLEIRWKPDETDTATLHVVLRDDRSGMSWTSIDLTRE